MKSWIVFSHPFQPDPDSPQAVVNLIGGAGQVGARPPDAWIALLDTGALQMGVSEAADWNALYNTCAGHQKHGDYLLFTTVPAFIVTKAFQNRENLCFGLKGATLTFKRPDSNTFPSCYDRFGPYWRRFLMASAGSNLPVVEPVIGPAPLGAWPIYFNPRPVSLAPPDQLATAEDYVADRHAMLLPPWSPAAAADKYFDIAQGEQRGLQARRRMRRITQRDIHHPDEPALISLWRAMDDAALRPEMLEKAQIELEGLPSQPGEQGTPTAPALKLAASGSDDFFSSYRRKAFILNTSMQTSPLYMAVREAVRTDMKEALGSEDAILSEEPAAPPVNPEDYVSTGLTRTPLPTASIFTMLKKLDDLDAAHDPSDGRPLSPGGLAFAEHCHWPSADGRTAVAAQAYAVRYFWKSHLRPPSRQVFVDIALWERGPFLEPGCLHELCHRKLRDPAQRFDFSKQSGYPSVKRNAPSGGWCVEISPQPRQEKRDKMLAALVMPLGTRFFWGGLAVLDDPNSVLDGSAVLA